MLYREVTTQIAARLAEPRRFMQIVFGARQVGKTTAISQAISKLEPLPSHYVTADDPALKGSNWLEQQWEVARNLANRNSTALLVIDEIHKIERWSEVVKKLWDEDTRQKIALKVALLGSAPLLLQQGLSESLTGRFETIYVPHWTLTEVADEFGLSLDHYIYFGGYPGSLPLIQAEERWRAYIRDSIIETTISRDLLLITRVEKPALLRRLFSLGCTFSGQIVSYQKMLGSLQDAGNTTTLAHYLDLLDRISLVAGLQKFAGNEIRKRGSSPKLMTYNTALISTTLQNDFVSTRNDPEVWGRFVESAVGAHLLNSGISEGFRVYYWLDRNREIDFILEKGSALVALEIKSGRARGSRNGMSEFKNRFPSSRSYLIGGDGIPIDVFLRSRVRELF